MSEDQTEMVGVTLTAVSKAKRGRGPTVEKWQLGQVEADGKVIVLNQKYKSPEAALHAIEDGAMENIGYMVRMIETKTVVKARLA